MFWVWGEALEEIYKIENVDSEDLMEEGSTTVMVNKYSLDIMMQDSPTVMFGIKNKKI